MAVRVSRNSNDFIFMVLYPIDTVFKAGLVVACNVGSVDSQPFPTLAAQWLASSESQESLLKIRPLWVQVGDSVDATTKVELVGEINFSELFVPASDTQAHVEPNAVPKDGQVLHVDFRSIDSVLLLRLLVGVDVVRLAREGQTITGWETSDLGA